MPAVLQAMSLKGRIALGASVLGVLLVAFLLFRVATQPSYTMLMSGLDPAKTGELTAALDAQGIPYELQNNGTALAVDKGATAQARVALAAQGLGGAETGGAQPGFEDLMSKQKLGTSDFQQRVTYQRALEGEIARTIDGVSGVGGARVQLTLPEDDLFADESKPATASVLLGGSGDAIEPAQVKGIASLVSGAVEGLKPDKVTITDSSGQLLWPQGDGGAAEGGVTTKTAAEARYAAQLEGSLMAMLERTLGPGKAQVVVRPDLDVDDATREQLTYDRRGVPQRQTTEDERLRGTGGANGGAAGATGNIAGALNGGAGGGTSNYRKTSEQTDYALNKTVERRKLAPGAVRRLDVALVLDQSVPAPLAAQLERTVATAAGVQADRGDTIEMTQLTMAKPPATAAPAGPLPAALLGYLKWAGLALAGLLFLALVTRGLRRREGEALGPEPTWLREIEEPRSVAELGAGGEAPTEIAPPPHPSRRSVEDLAKDDPQRIAAQLKGWLAEDQAA
jgi:flagellar M-ring protein FliF